MIRRGSRLGPVASGPPTALGPSHGPFKAVPTRRTEAQAPDPTCIPGRSHHVIESRAVANVKVPRSAKALDLNRGQRF